MKADTLRFALLARFVNRDRIVYDCRHEPLVVRIIRLAIGFSPIAHLLLLVGATNLEIRRRRKKELIQVIVHAGLDRYACSKAQKHFFQLHSFPPTLQ